MCDRDKEREQYRQWSLGPLSAHMEIDPHAPGAKLDAGKPDTSLLLDFHLALLEVAAVGTYGAKKYSRGGWKTVPDGVDRYTAAMLRHLLAEQVGERDEESDLRHAAQVAWNALARLQLLLTKPTT